MKVWVLGSHGEVGIELCRALAPTFDVVASSASDLDITNTAALASTMIAERPAVIVNAAGYTDVDRAQIETDLAHRVNAAAVGDLGRLALEHRVALLHLSTDFVFDGTKGRAYVEADAANPVNAYGHSKLAGEQTLLALRAPAIIFRTACVFGSHRPCFVSNILRLARHHEVLRVVDDQIGNPTSSADLAAAIAQTLTAARSNPFDFFNGHRGVYHVAGHGSCSRHALALAALALDPDRAQHVVRSVEPVASSAFPLPAPRPGNTTLDCTLARRSLGISLPPWREALARVLSP